MNSTSLRYFAQQPKPTQSAPAKPVRGCINLLLQDSAAFAKKFSDFFDKTYGPALKELESSNVFELAQPGQEQWIDKVLRRIEEKNKK